MKGKWIAVVLAGVGVLGCEPLDRLVRGAADGLRSPRGVRVIALTDFHGALEPRRLTAKFEDGTEETLISGGAAYLAAYVEKLRGESPFPAVVVDAGDLFQGTFLSNSEEGRPVTEFYNELGVDAAAVGNHEFDFGPVGPSTAPQSPGEDPVGALKAQMKRARFAFLSLNIREKATGKSPAWARPSVLLERGGVKVGIIGATTPSTPFTTLRTNVAHLDFLKDMEGLIRDEAAELRARGAEVVVLAIHEGGSCLENGKAHGTRLRDCTGDIFPLSRALVGHVDVVVAGHTHQVVNKVVTSGNGERSLALLQAGSRGEFLVYADVPVGGTPSLHDPVGICPEGVAVREVPGANGATVETRGCDGYFLKAPVSRVEAPSRGERVAPVAPVEALVERYQAKVGAALGRSAKARTLTPFNRSYTDENALANLVTDLMREGTGADIALYNNGGVRADLPAADLTYRHIFEVLPFDDNVSIAEVSGAEIRRIVEKDARNRNDGAMAWSGIRARIEGCEVRSLSVVDVSGRERPLEEDRLYRLATTVFLITKFDSLTGSPLDPSRRVRATGTVVRDVAFEALRGRVLESSRYFDPEAPRIAYFGECP